MTDLLTSLGTTVVPIVAGPVLAWTLAAGLTECSLRVSASPAELRLPVRRALLFSLPAILVLAAVWTAFASVASQAAIRGALAVVTLPAVTVGVDASDAFAPAWSLWTMWGAVVVAVVGVAVSGLVRLGVGWWRVRRYAVGPAVDVETMRVAREVADSLGLDRLPEIVRVSAGTPPYTVGAFEPRVALPDGLDADAARLMLAHEFAHVRRRDFAWTLAERTVTALCSAHPLVHILAAGAALDRECLADGDVLTRHPSKRRRYADLLLHFATQPAPALAVGAASSHPLTSRLLAMKRLASPSATRRSSRLGRSLAVGLVALLTSATLSVAAPGTAGSAVQPDLAGSSTVGASPSGFAGDVRQDTVVVFDVVDEQPELIGGLEALQASIVYPRLQMEAGIEGRSFVQFVVTPTGSVRDAVIVRSSGDAALDAAAVAAVESARFRPGKQDGQAVAVRFAIPITFRFSVPAELGPDGAVVPPPPPPSAPSPPPSASEPPPNAPAPPPPPPPPPGVDPPQLIGGFDAFQQAIVYPELAKRAGIEGSAFVKFVVSEDGTTRDIEVVRTAGDDALDAAAIAAVRTARFRPGRKDGEIRPMQSILPIHFRLPSVDE